MTRAAAAADERELAGFREVLRARRAAAYERFFSPTTDRLARRLLDVVPLRPGGLAVDVGCGPGGLLAELERRGWQALGVDLVPAMLRRARARVAAPLVVGDAVALPLPVGTADLVVLAFVVPHLPDPAAALHEARRVLRPGGLLACVTWLEPRRSPLTGLVIDAIRGHCRLPDNLRALLDDLEGRADRLVALAATAGLTPRLVQDVEDERRLLGAEEWWRGVLAGSVGLAPLLQTLGPEQRRTAEQAFRIAAAAFWDGTALRVPVAARLLVAEAPAAASAGAPARLRAKAGAGDATAERMAGTWRA